MKRINNVADADPILGGYEYQKGSKYETLIIVLY